MNLGPPYKNPPITEALIDIRVVQEQGYPVEELEVIENIVADRYPRKDTEFVYEGKVGFDEPGEAMKAEGTHRHNGFRFTSQDQSLAFHAQIDGFVFHLRGSYRGWEQFRDEARNLWETYKEAASIQGISRIAVRYVNHIQIPWSTAFPLEQYLRIHPQLSEEWSEKYPLSGFFMQLQMPQEDLESWLLVNQAISTPSEESSSLTIVLDADLFHERFQQPWTLDEESRMWNLFEQLRTRKNEFFETSITDDTRRLFQ